jgi:hypothetical protein
VQEGLRKEGGNPLKNVYGQVVLGGKEFVGRVKDGLKGKSLSAGIVVKTHRVS